MPLGHARILIGVVLFAAIAGLAAALLPGTQEEPSSPGPELADVQSALRAALGEDAAGVQVALSDRTVVLQGAVPSEDLRRRAVQSVLALDAVVEVDDELRVSPR
ncbi:MAG TPA: BON domain-containing protein [Myxococcota bacterium]|nr:BON domain-containing protein [Myxococcota bacterium]